MIEFITWLSNEASQKELITTVLLFVAIWSCCMVQGNK